MMKIFQEKFGKSEYLRNFAIPNDNKGNAEIAQLVEHNLAKVGVASSSLVCRSSFERFLNQYFLKNKTEFNELILNIF